MTLVTRTDYRHRLSEDAHALDIEHARSGRAARRPYGVCQNARQSDDGDEALAGVITCVRSTAAPVLSPSRIVCAGSRTALTVLTHLPTDRLARTGGMPQSLFGA